MVTLGQAHVDDIRVLSDYLSTDTMTNVNPPLDTSVRLSPEVLAFLSAEGIVGCISSMANSH